MDIISYSKSMKAKKAIAALNKRLGEGAHKSGDRDIADIQGHAKGRIEFLEGLRHGLIDRVKVVDVLPEHIVDGQWVSPEVDLGLDTIGLATVVPKGTGVSSIKSHTQTDNDTSYVEAPSNNIASKFGRKMKVKMNWDPQAESFSGYGSHLGTLFNRNSTQTAREIRVINNEYIIGETDEMQRYSLQGAWIASVPTAIGQVDCIAHDANYIYYAIGNTGYRCNLDFTNHVSFDISAFTVITTPRSWTIKNGKFYIVESATYKIHVFTYDSTKLVAKEKESVARSGNWWFITDMFGETHVNDHTGNIFKWDESLNTWTQLTTGLYTNMIAFVVRPDVSGEIVGLDYSLAAMPRISVSGTTGSTIQPTQVEIHYKARPLLNRVSEVERNTNINLNKHNLRVNAILNKRKYELKDMLVDDFEDATGIDSVKSLNVTHDAQNQKVKQTSIASPGELITVNELVETVPTMFSLSAVTVDNNILTKSFDITQGVLTDVAVTNGTMALAVAGTKDGKTIYKKSGSWISQVMDLGDNVKTIKELDLLLGVPQGTTIKIYTSTSSDNVAFSEYQLVDALGTVSSPTARYLKVKAELAGGYTLSSDTTVHDFLSGESAHFNASEFVIFDGQLKPNHSYPQVMANDSTFAGEGVMVKAAINKANFKSILKLEVK